MTNNIHIGKTIKELLIAQGVSVIDFAEKINCTPRNVYKIFGKSYIDTALLSKINSALGQNLFLLYVTNEEIQTLKSLQKTKSVEFMATEKFSRCGCLENSIAKA